jgi:hypothetical protein
MPAVITQSATQTKPMGWVSTKGFISAATLPATKLSKSLGRRHRSTPGVSGGGTSHYGAPSRRSVSCVDDDS